jgi:hypothetical protein
MRALLAALLVLPLALAGCLAGSQEPAPASAEVPLLADALSALEAGEPAANVALVGEWRNGGAAEAAAHGDLLYVMRGGHVDILDVSDPAEIVEAGVVQGPHTVKDVKLSDDGRYLFIGDDNRLSGAALHGKVPANPANVQNTGGLYVYDVANPAAPALVAYAPIGEQRGPHMVAYHRYPDGREVVFGASGEVTVHLFDRAAGTLTEVARYQPDLVFGFNRDPEVVDALYQGWAHDMFPMTEPDGTVLLYVANWDAGLRIVDVTDPASPKELGGWNGFPKGHEGNLHTVATQWMDGRRITVGAVEVGFAVVGGYHYAMGTDANVVYVWDTTDPAAIGLLGFWQNPVEPYSGRDQAAFGEELTSTHNLQLEDGRVYMAHYGMGVYVLDVRTPETQAAPAVLGFYHEAGMDTWDVVLHKGMMFSSGAEGVLALHYLPDALGEAGLESRA